MILALVLAGCGQTGDLVLPDRADQPVAGAPDGQSSDPDRKPRDDDQDQD